MKISELINALSAIERQYGNIECELQDEKNEKGEIIGNEFFYIVPEEYEDGWRVNIRSWPY